MTEFEKIYRTYFKDVFLYIKGLSGDEHIAEEITAETFFSAMKGLDGFRGTCDIRVWLCQIAKNCYISYLRKNRKLAAIAEIEEKPDDFDMERFLCGKEESAKVYKIIHNLAEPYKEVFMLRVFGELSFKQIAGLFGKSEKNAVTGGKNRQNLSNRMETFL